VERGLGEESSVLRGGVDGGLLIVVLDGTDVRLVGTLAGGQPKRQEENGKDQNTLHEKRPVIERQ
jgi:hypothetical protein